MILTRNDQVFTVSDFIKDNKFNYGFYSRDDGDNFRTYDVDGKKVPSVTTILTTTQSKEKKQGLQRWRDRIGHEEAARITSQAATRGTEMHYVLEQYMNGQGYFNLSKDGSLPRMMAHTIIENLQDLSRVYGTEVSLAYKDQWAGSSDLICEYANKPTIADFKQSNKTKREEWIEDYFYQIGAYSLAHKLQYGDIRQGLILICTKDLVFQKYVMSETMLKEYEDKWLEKMQDFRKIMKKTSS